MAEKKGNPGCPCCCCEKTPDCTLLDDAFGADTIAAYNQVSGTWSISSGALRTSASHAVILWGTELPAAHSIRVFGLGYTGGLSNNFRYILGWKDADNYLYLRVLNTAYLSLWQVVGGVPTQLTAQKYISPDYVNGGVLVCWLPSQNLLSYTVRDVAEEDDSWGYDHATTADSSNFGTYAGVGTGTITASQVSFSRLQAYSAGENCEHCFCNVCKVGTTPESITIEFEGVENGDCDQCDLFNTTAFVLDPFGHAQCSFYFSNLQTVIDCSPYDYSTPGDYTDIRASITCDDTVTNANSYLNVRVRFYVPGSGYRETFFRKRLGCCKLDCKAAIVPGLILQPYITGADTACAWSNAICRVAAVT